MDTDPTRPDLSLVDTDWMIEALKSRCDAMVIARLPKANPENIVISDRHGGLHACLGMAVTLKRDILNDITEPDDDDAD